MSDRFEEVRERIGKVEDRLFSIEEMLREYRRIQLQEVGATEAALKIKPSTKELRDRGKGR